MMMMMTIHFLSIALIAAFASTATHAWVMTSPPRAAHQVVSSTTLFSTSPPVEGDSAAAAAAPSAEEMSKMDYAHQISDLSVLLKETQEKIARMKALVSYIKQLEIEDESLSKLPPEAASLKAAIAEARAAKEMHGANSPEAIRTWDEVEECAGSDECNVGSMYRYSPQALKAHHYYDAVIDVELLGEAEEALDVIDSLRSSIQVENNRLGGGGSSSSKEGGSSSSAKK